MQRRLQQFMLLIMRFSMNPNLKRARCPQCQRPLQTCICQWITITENHVELVILQHPLEVNNAKNTAGLLHKSLQKSQLHIGETFDDRFLADLLMNDDKTNLLLYPQVAEETSLGLAVPPALPSLSAISADAIRLIVLDGTWRKSRKMLYLNRQLQALPRLSLSDCPGSLYHIRKSQKDNQLSTLEASCYALRQLENARVDYNRLLAAFNGFVRQHLAFMPPRT
jgi:DTW domain-containing protein YfiP